VSPIGTVCNTLTSDLLQLARPRGAALQRGERGAGLKYPVMNTIITTVPGAVMLPPMGGLLLAWSGGGGQASHADSTSDKSEAEEESKWEDGENDSTFWREEELFDSISQEVLNSPEPNVEMKTCVSKAEAQDNWYSRGLMIGWLG
jgi:hypothetical protein